MSARAALLEWVSLVSFRSYTDVRWDPEPGVNVLVGRNGAGKSNLLEGIGYLATMKSFRGAPDEAMVSFDADSAYVRGEIGQNGVTTLVEVEIKRRGGRRANVNKQRLARTADLLDPRQGPQPV